MISVWWSWALALTGCAGFWLIGSGKRWGWAVNIGVQALWLTYAVVTKQWGFVLGSLFYAVVFVRNLRRAYSPEVQELLPKQQKRVFDGSGPG